MKFAIVFLLTWPLAAEIIHVTDINLIGAGTFYGDNQDHFWTLTWAVGANAAGDTLSIANTGGVGSPIISMRSGFPANITIDGISGNGSNCGSFFTLANGSGLASVQCGTTLVSADLIGSVVITDYQEFYDQQGRLNYYGGSFHIVSPHPPPEIPEPKAGFLTVTGLAMMLVWRKTFSCS